MEIVIDKKLNIEFHKTVESERLYSADVVIDAYLKGKKDSLEQEQKALISRLEANIVQAAKDTAKVIITMQTKGVNPIAAYLKLASFDAMNVVLTVTEKDFVSDNIITIYDNLTLIEQTVSEDLYKISFNLAVKGDHFNASLLESDGYYFASSGFSK